MSIPLDTIYSYFETGDFPTQKEFKKSWSSFWHKDEAIPMSKITGLSNQFQYKVDKTAFDNHVLSSEAHVTYLAKSDASNLNPENIQSWKNVLGVKQLLNNLATFDDGSNIGNVYTKNQSDSKYMFLQDFLNSDNKILAEKIEALGLTTLIEATEKSIVEFAERSDLYKFEDNDFIAVPDGEGNFSLYLYKGGDKKVKSNYLSTGLSNITMGMVEGLQGEINKIEVVQGELINVNTKLQIKADKATVLEQFGTFTTSLETKADKFTLQQEVTRIKGIEDRLVNVNANLLIKADKAAVDLELNKIKVVEEGLANVNADLLIKADKATVLEQFGTFTTSLGNKADKAAIDLELNKIKVVEEGLANVNADLLIKADKSTVLEQFGTFTTSLETKADKFTLQQEVTRIKGVEDGLVDVNANLLIKADKAAVDLELSKIKVVEEGLANVNADLLIKADKSTVLEQFGTLNTALETKVDLETAQVEFNKIKLVEEGVSSLNLNLQAKADKAAVQEQISVLDTNLKTKIDLETAQVEFNKIKLVENGVASLNLNLQAKADKSAVIEQFSTLNTTLETKVDLETAQVEFNKIKLVENGVASLNLNLQAKADKATVDASLQNKADKNALENHVWAPDSHVSYLAKIDASNLDEKNIYEWQKALRISGQTEPTRNYKIYRALLNVDEESFEPKFIVLENTIGDIIWRRDDVGFYTGRIEKDFPKGRAWINSKVNISFKKSPPIDCMAIMSEDQVINLNILARNNDYVPIDLRGEFGIIEMYVYDIEK